MHFWNFHLRVLELDSMWGAKAAVDSTGLHSRQPNSTTQQQSLSAGQDLLLRAVESAIPWWAPSQNTGWRYKTSHSFMVGVCRWPAATTFIAPTKLTVHRRVTEICSSPRVWTLWLSLCFQYNENEHLGIACRSEHTCLSAWAQCPEWQELSCAVL